MAVASADWVQDTGDDDWDEEFDEDHDEVPELRWDAYKSAWKHCLDRIQHIVHKLHEPVVNSISQQIGDAYSQTLPGLPHSELPVIAVSNLGGGSTFLDELTRHLDPDEDDEEPSIYTNHISPAQCPNITNGMRALITGFTKRPPDKRKTPRTTASSSLASYDITILDAWYSAVRKDREKRDQPLPNLVVLLHDFERFDPSIMQDILYICSLHIPKIPIVFVVSLLSPQSPTYLHVTYPRSTLAVLRIRQFSVPSGAHLLDEIILGTFFSNDFRPDIILGPAALSFIVDQFERYDSSVESLIHTLQLAYLKHFTHEPLSLLCYTMPSESESFSFESLLFTRLVTEKDVDVDAWTRVTLGNKVLNARDELYESAQVKRVGFGLLRLVYQFLKILSDVDVLVAKIKNLKLSEVELLLSEMHDYFEEASDERNAIVNLQDMEDGRRAKSGLAHWFHEYIEDTAAPLDDLTLAEVWYTGLTPYPMELINPSMRSTVVGGLLRPYEFASPPSSESVWAGSIADLPDTSILFQRYLDSGRMINVYDWYESFRGVLEMQREEGRASPRKKGKGKAKAKDKKDEKKWQLECQARFMRALHELDYMGFLKHTGRKADHVLKTVFEIGDDE
ncbi:hypothetical protein BDZ89DRAFT_1167180 [Hymenopellis radicata]|nr:hypothetical protein BDZ89DRAFT_1167180 [Hymenopellis radicata]